MAKHPLLNKNAQAGGWNICDPNGGASGEGKTREGLNAVLKQCEAAPLAIKLPGKKAVGGRHETWGAETTTPEVPKSSSIPDDYCVNCGVCRRQPNGEEMDTCKGDPDKLGQPHEWAPMADLEKNIARLHMLPPKNGAAAVNFSKYPRAVALSKNHDRSEYGNWYDVQKSQNPTRELEKAVVYETLSRLGPDVSYEYLGKVLPQIRKACGGDILAAYEKNQLADVLDDLGFFGRKSDRLRGPDDQFYASYGKFSSRKEAFTGLWNHLMQKPEPEMPPVRKREPGENVCPNCGGGMTRKKLPGSEQTQFVCTKCQYSPSKKQMTSSKKTAGASEFSTVSSGKTAEEAYRKAVEQAAAEYGHQQGYSGVINSTRGFQMITPPQGVKPQRYAQWVMEGGENPRDYREMPYKDGQKCPETNIYQGAGKPVIKKCNGTIVMKPGERPRCTAGHGLGYSGRGSGDQQKFFYYKAFPIKPEYLAKVKQDAEAIKDKWGPCGCISLGGGKWMFFGWAPS